MNSETQNREAFEHVVSAMQALSDYRATKTRLPLDRARAELNKALAKDSQYLRARYLSGIAADLAGEARIAIDTLTKVIDENPPFAEEARFNLGVAFYHRYSWQYLDQAIEQFHQVLEATPSRAPLYALAEAALAQTYGMHMIPPNFSAPDVDVVFRYYRKASELADRALQASRKAADDIQRDITWRAHNAAAIAEMYYTDYYNDDLQRRLDRAAAHLAKADAANPRDWAIYCNRGSLAMRRGYWLKESKAFDEALRLLDIVLLELKPNYGFAWYEKGRTLRLLGKYREAIVAFDEALKIDNASRAVGEVRVTEERRLAEARNSIYPSHEGRRLRK